MALLVVPTWAVVATICALTMLVLGRLGFKGLFRVILSTYRRARMLWLRIRGLTPSDVAERRVVTGQSWDEFCDTLKAAGASLLAPGAPTDAFNQAEGYRYLSRIARAGLEAFVECADPAAPQFVSLVNGDRIAPCKLGSDNPDNFYQTARVRGDTDYIVRGTRGTVNVLTFGYQAGNYGGAGGLKTISTLDSGDIEFEDDGSSFVIVVSSTRPEGARNWLRTVADPPEGLVMVRQTFMLRDTEVPATVSICRRGVPNPTPSTWTPQALDDGLSQAGMLVAGAPIMFAKWAKGFQSHTNKLPLFDQATSDAVGGDPNIRYYHSYWRLADDEALVIEAHPPACDHWNFQLNNHWMESLDYRYFRIHVNKGTATYRDGGRSVLIIVSHSDPGVADANWINTVGHRQGTMCFRWVKAQVPDESLPHPTARVVKSSELAGL